MSEPPSSHDLARQLAVLEERMNAKQAEYESALDRLRADMARSETRQAERDARNFQWTVGLVVAAVVIMGGIGIFAS